MRWIKEAKKPVGRNEKGKGGETNRAELGFRSDRAAKTNRVLSAADSSPWLLARRCRRRCRLATDPTIDRTTNAIKSGRIAGSARFRFRAVHLLVYLCSYGRRIRASTIPMDTDDLRRGKATGKISGPRRSKRFSPSEQFRLGEIPARAFLFLLSLPDADPPGMRPGRNKDRL